MDHFDYRDGVLHCENVDLVALARAAGTPLYVYSTATIGMHYDRLREAFAGLNARICFSVKSCPNLSVLRFLGERGAGMDVVSGGELHRARLAGVPAGQIVYAGVGKSDEEIRLALGFGHGVGEHSEPIGLLNIESEAEFQNIASIARTLGVRARGALRINPDVDPHTHVYTTTGKRETKFGVDLERARAFFRKYGSDPNLDLCALHLHIGSPVYETGPYVEAVERTLELMSDLEGEGYRITSLDLGGGFGADYETGRSPSAADYAAAIEPLLRRRVEEGLEIVLEPGRSIMANAGVLLIRVLYVKQSGVRQFLVCDGGMHTLLRPALYGSFHFIWPVSVAPQHVPEKRSENMDLPGLVTCDVVGPVCESGDFLGKDRSLPPVAPGDLLAVFGAGAYGISMASRYNSHPLPAEVLVRQSRAELVRRRETYDDLVAHESGPEQLPL